MTYSLTVSQQEILCSLRKTAVVLILMFQLDRPVRAKEVSSLLRIDYETARGYLSDLSRLGSIARTRSGWILTSGGRQLVLPAKNAENPRYLKVSVDSDEKNAEESAFLSLTTTAYINDSESLNTESINHKSLNIDAVVVTEKSAENPRFSAESAEIPRFSIPDPEQYDANLVAMGECGIKQNQTTRALAAMEHVTPEYIRAHVLHARANRERLGMAIRRMIDGDPDPRQLEDPNRFVSGEFAEFIEY